GKPRADAVPTASWIFTLHHVRKGTEMKAPPAPTIEDTTPMSVPAPNMPAVPGSVRVALGLRSTSIWVAENATKIANSTPSDLPGSAALICAPSKPPATMPGASTATTFQSTAPRRSCARIDESEVKQMVASDVATAILTVYSAGKPRCARTMVTKGTMII